MRKPNRIKQNLIKNHKKIKTPFQLLKRKYDKLEIICDLAPIGLCIVDEQGVFEYVNEFYCKLYGYTEKELLKNHFSIIIPPEIKNDLIIQHQEFMRNPSTTTKEFKVVNKNGIQFSVMVTSIYFIDKDNSPKKASYVIDITERKKTEEDFRYLAYHDLLTELPNRKYFTEALKAAIENSDDSIHMLAIMFLDLDKFKHVNDIFGHSAGDLLLQSVSNRLKKVPNNNYTLARFGGDEFTILLPEVYHIENIIRTAEKVKEQFERPFFIQGRKVFMTISIGISISPYDGNDSESLLRAADIAMYNAKSFGSNNYQFYTSPANITSFTEFALENGQHP
ncbi:MAG: diguanylate cyclase [Epulopiscium sp.]|nr:diguanylate cyclase [Candidatus Epulonipiscium sp.]